MCLTTLYLYSMVVIMQNSQEKVELVDLQKIKVNAMKMGKFVRTEIKFILRKNGGQIPSSLAVGRLLWWGRQTKCLQFIKFLKFNNFNSKACLGCLNGLMMPVDKQPVFEGNIIVRLVFQTWKPYIPRQSLLLGTILFNDNILYGY